MADSRSRSKKPAVPQERHETIRQEIAEVLAGRSLTAREISGLVRIPEKDVYPHLEHIHRSFEKGALRLRMEPASCMHCGFVFRKRERLKKPGRCPVCKSEHITPPAFMLSPDT